MFSKISGRTMILLVFFCLPALPAFSGEQCIAHYDLATNVIRIPCVAIGGQEIWANLRLSSPEDLQFEVVGYGEDFLPAWLTELIAGFESEPVSNPPRIVTQYRYAGNTVYHVTSPCCDQFNDLYDAGGMILCAPDGGITGTGDGRCSDFFDTATGAVIVWQDRRTPE